MLNAKEGICEYPLVIIACSISLYFKEVFIEIQAKICLKMRYFN